MAPHDTNTQKERRRHAVPLIGMAVLVALVAIGFFWFMGRSTEGIEDADEVTETVPPDVEVEN